MIKQLLVGVALFGVTATSVSAWSGSDWLQYADLNLTEAEQTALEEAETIRDNAMVEAKAVLTEAGIDEERMQEIRQAKREGMKEVRDEVKAAIEANDYSAFTATVAGSPLADSIDTEAEFAKLVEAHNLREAGDRAGAIAIMKELDLPGLGHMEGRGGHRGGNMPD
jgi:hypothetical protein